MTYHGTNSWLLEEADGLTVIDPGPEDAAHMAALLAASGGRVRRIVLTHTHSDHLGAAAGLRAATGAPIFGWGAPWQAGFVPDQALGDGERVGGLTAIHTPGHASDHVCFAWDQGGLFSGDHVMSWNTSIVSPPDGDMAAYMASLRLLMGREDGAFYCGHGAGAGAAGGVDAGDAGASDCARGGGAGGAGGWGDVAVGYCGPALRGG